MEGLKGSSLYLDKPWGGVLLRYTEELYEWAIMRRIREALPKKKVTKLRTFSVPPLAHPPLPASTDTHGGLFS